MVKEKDINSRELSREALQASVSSSVKWGQPCFSPMWSCQLCSGAPACLLKRADCSLPLPPLCSVMSFWWLGAQGKYFHHVCVCKSNHSVVSNSLQLHGWYCQAPLSMGVLQARIRELAAIPFSRGSSLRRDRTLGLLHCGKILYHLSTREALKRVRTELLWK